MGDLPHLVNEPGRIEWWDGRIGSIVRSGEFGPRIASAAAATAKAPDKSNRNRLISSRLIGIGNRATLSPAQLERTGEQDTAFDARVSVHSGFQGL